MMILCSSQRVEYQGVNVEGGVMKLSRVAFLWGYNRVSREGCFKSRYYRDTYVGTHTIQLEKATEPSREAVVFLSLLLTYAQVMKSFIIFPSLVKTARLLLISSYYENIFQSPGCGCSSLVFVVYH